MTILGKTTVPFFPTQMKLSQFTCDGNTCSHMVQWLIANAFSSFQNMLTQSLHTQQNLMSRSTTKCRQEAMQRVVTVNIAMATNEEKLSLTTDESYNLAIKSSDTEIFVTITAPTFFGARHGLETLSQMTAYSDTYNSLQIISAAKISDKPAYPYRGLLLDTSRNFFSVKSIKRLIKAMSYNKMNTLHWHITDTHSFPIEIKSVPEFLQYGAYDHSKVYTHVDVQDIVSHAAYHGVRVLPEFDEPAHCGEGWQFGEKAGLGKLAVCVNREPWQKYCVEPPCGQLNPINDRVYDVLSKIYKEYFALFKPDLFHAGGDEININCWNTTDEITDWLTKNYGGRQEKDIMRMWGMFLNVCIHEYHNTHNLKFGGNYNYFTNCKHEFSGIISW